MFFERVHKMTIKRRIPQLKIEDPAVLTDQKLNASVLICANLWPKSFLRVLQDLHGKNKKIRENPRNPEGSLPGSSDGWLNIYY